MKTSCAGLDIDKEKFMSYGLLAIALIIAILDWIAVAKRWKLWEYFAKPGVIIVLLIWLWSVSGFSGHLVWFALGLVFSLAGDVFLMLPREQFIAGLVAFLLAHIAYIIGFNDTRPPLNLVSIFLAIAVGITTLRIYGRIHNGLIASNNKKLKTPVLVYSIVISLMLLSALLTLVRPEWSAGSSLLVSAGALLFFLSDVYLAWNKFVTPVRHGDLIVIVSYHTGQMLITVGAAMYFMQAI